MPVKIITPVAVEPISLAVLQSHLRVDVVNGVSEEDELIGGWLSAAREFAEHYTNRALAPQTLELALDAFPAGAIVLPSSPVTSITSIKYIDVDGVEQTWSSAAYSLNDYGLVAKVEMAYATPWPATRVIANAVKVRFVAGYVTVPKTVRSALLLIVGHLYENRAEVIMGRLKPEQVPFGARALLDTIELQAI